MARFVAKYAKYRHGIRKGEFMVLADGQRQELSKELFAKFDRGILTDAEENIGITGLRHHGLPIDRDTEEHYSPRSRLSGFDTDKAALESGWSDKDKELVEYVLRNSDSYGIEFIELTKPKARKPWATYDDMAASQIVSVARDIGFPLVDVLAYEEQNQDRTEVKDLIGEAITALTEDPDAVVIEA